MPMPICPVLALAGAAITTPLDVPFPDVWKVVMIVFPMTSNVPNNEGLLKLSSVAGPLFGRPKLPSSVSFRQ